MGRKAEKEGLPDLSFLEADASRLEGFPSGAFDFAVLSLVLHEIPRDQRIPLLDEAKRVAREVIIADYSIPLPQNPAGLMVRTIELLAGPHHFKGFLSFAREGGVLPLLLYSSLEARETRREMKGTVVVVRAGEPLPSKGRPWYSFHHESAD